MTRKTKSDLMAELEEAVRASQAATQQMDEAGGRALGINGTDGRCMDIVQRAGRIAAGELAERAGLTTGSVTAVADRLERKGYLRRVADPGDRRRVLLELTELAERRTAELWGPLGKRGIGRLSGFGVPELETVIRFLRIGTELSEMRAAEIRAELNASA